MNILQFLTGLFSAKPIEQGLEIILEKTEDVDKRNNLFLEYVKQKEETKRQESARVTIPWVDALHKMGRQLFWLVAFLSIVILIALGRLEEVLHVQELLSYVLAGGGLYTIIKGRGK